MGSPFFAFFFKKKRFLLVVVKLAMLGFKWVL